MRAAGTARRAQCAAAGDVAALSCDVGSEGFDARRDATSRAYCYRVLVRGARSAFEGGRLCTGPALVDLEPARGLRRAVVGTHDFTAFTPTETEHVRFSRDVFAAFWRRAELAGRGEFLEFWIEADAFMRHMNRVLVGTMLQVSDGRRTVASFASLLEGRSRSDAGPTAPPHGLYLAGIGYGGERVLGAGPDGVGASG